MPHDFRNSCYKKKVKLGKRTVKEGECAAVWNLNGEYRCVEGPKREWLFASRVHFMDRYVADEHQYLIVKWRNGRKEHIRGPKAMFHDPVRHEEIRLEDAVKVDAFEVIVVYTENEDAEVKRSVIRGPTVFIPTTHQWLHTFSWHGTPSLVTGKSRSSSTETPPNLDPELLAEKVPNALKFTKLRTIADQFYFNAKDVRTKDDAILKVKIMIFFQICDLEQMLDSTHDPIGDMINAVSADLMNFTAKHTYEEFIQEAAALSEIDTFPVLLQRADTIGFQINKVVYRGYSSSGQLQQMQDNAIRLRTERKLQQEEEETKQGTLDLELRRKSARQEQEHAKEAETRAHKLKLYELEHQQKLRHEQENNEESLRSKGKELQLDLEQLHKKNEVEAQYLAQLKQHGVDLTRYLCSQQNKPDKIVQVVTDGLNSGKPGSSILGPVGLQLPM